jgi:hypothetical protein
MPIIFFDIKWIVHKKFFLAGQTVDSAYCFDISWRLRGNVQTLRHELAIKVPAVASRQHNVSHFLFNQGFFKSKQHDCHPPLTLLYSVSPTEDKTERPPF